VFRKRALVNGAGLLQAGPGAIGFLYDQDFAEMTATLHIVAEGFVQSVFRMGELIAKNETDKRIFRLAAQDESRHVAFGVMHCKHLIETQPERKDEIASYIRRQGAAQGGATIATGNTTSEALAILLGGGKGNIDEGYKMLMAVRQKQIKELAQRLKVCGLTEMGDEMLARIALEDAKETPVKDPSNQAKFDREIAKSVASIAKAYADWELLEYEDAICRFLRAWEHAQRAIRIAGK